MSQSPLDLFHNAHYLEINEARLSHLASIVERTHPRLKGARVLELGAGVGDHTPFWLERGCSVTVTEARPENVDLLRERFPDLDVRSFDINLDPAYPELFDVVYAYGILYHLHDPGRLIELGGRMCTGAMFVETCVSYGEDATLNPVEEDTGNPSQALNGRGCRPSRRWVFEALGSAFPFVYHPRTQPAHDQFPLDWTAAPPPPGTLTRTTFVASKGALAVEGLEPRLLDRQTRFAPGL